MEGIFPYILPPHRVRVRVLRRFGLNKGVNFAYFGLNSGMVFKGIRECMNVFSFSFQMPANSKWV